MCINAIGSYQCSCGSGYQLNSHNGHACDGTKFIGSCYVLCVCLLTTSGNICNCHTACITEHHLNCHTYCKTIVIMCETLYSHGKGKFSEHIQDLAKKEVKLVLEGLEKRIFDVFARIQCDFHKNLHEK